MGEDASLEEFLGDADAESAGTADETRSEPGEETPETEASGPGEAAAPATTTYAWDGDGTACGSCGEVVERRWQQDGTLVCVACKTW